MRKKLCLISSLILCLLLAGCAVRNNENLLAYQDCMTTAEYKIHFGENDFDAVYTKADNTIELLSPEEIKGTVITKKENCTEIGFEGANIALSDSIESGIMPLFHMFSLSYDESCPVKKDERGYSAVCITDTLGTYTLYFDLSDNLSEIVFDGERNFTVDSIITDMSQTVGDK